MNQKDTEVIGRVIRTEMDVLRAEFKTAIADIKLMPGPAGPAGKDGADGADGKDGKDGLQGLAGPQGEAGKDGINGKDGADGVKGKDGANGFDGKNGADGIDGKDGANGLNGKDAAPGIDGKDGRDGRDGKDGRDGMDAFELPIATGIDTEKAYPRNALATDKGALWRYDGSEWKCLVDGLSHIDLEQKDERTLTVKQVFASGKTSEIDMRVPAIIYRQIFNAETDYEPGDFVTHNGSVWACIKPTNATPGTKDGGWRLAVKRGLNGRSK